ncbi:glycosyltransferase family 2 protein [Pseudomonas aeruginosa]
MGVDVSILMPVYNEVLHLEEALQSISEQGEKLSIEVVCVDDFSTDGTWQLMEQLRNKYDFLKCYKNEKKVRTMPSILPMRGLVEVLWCCWLVTINLYLTP